MKCPSCNQTLPDQSKYCRYCGAKVGEPPAVPVCPECGRPVRADAKFCGSCGAALPSQGPSQKAAASVSKVPVSASGSKINQGSQASGDPDLQGSSPIPAEKAPSPKQPGNGRAAEKSKRSASPGSETGSRSRPRAADPEPAGGKKRGGFLKGLLALGLAGIFLVQCVPGILDDPPWGTGTTSGPGVVSNPGDPASSAGRPADQINLTAIAYSQEELQAQGIETAVSPERPVVTAGDARVDFGSFNLLGESTLEVKRLPQKTDPRSGVTVNGFDFSLSDKSSGETISSFPTLVDITIPCTASPEEHAFVQYYDPANDEWRIIDSQRDYEKNTLTFQTTHFSIFGESKLVLGKHFVSGEMVPTQSFAFVGGYDGPLTEVYFVMANLDELMTKIDYDKMIQILNTCKVDPNDMISALLGLGNDAANTLELNVTNKLIHTLMRSEPGFYWSKNLTIIGSALVFAKVAYQLYIGGDVETVAYLNAVELTEALFAVAGLALGSEALLMMATAIFISNTVYSLATLEITTIQEQGYINFNDRLGAVFYAESMEVEPKDRVSLSQEYFIPSGPILLDRGGSGFARALDAIYLHYKDQPAELQTAIQRLIDGYVDCFWDSSALTDEDKVFYAYYKEKYDKDNPPVWVEPSPERITKYKTKFRNKLLSDIKPLMEAFARRVLHDLKLSLRDKIESDYVPFLNTVVTIQADTVLPDQKSVTFDQTAFGKDYFMRFSPRNLPFWVSVEDYERDYAPQARADSNEIYKSTVYNYLQIGDPAEIELIDEIGGSDYSDDFYAEIDWTTFPDGKIRIQPFSGIYTGKSQGKPLNGTFDKLLYDAVRIEETGSGLRVGPCLENGDHEQELQVLCEYNAESGLYEGVKRLESGDQWTELIFAVSITVKDGVPTADVAYVQHFSSRGSWVYEYDVKWTSTLSGSETSRPPSRQPDPQTDAPKGGLPVGGSPFP